jgi:hypothetical protein
MLCLSGTYVYLCEVVWCNYNAEDAGLAMQDTNDRKRPAATAAVTPEPVPAQVASSELTPFVVKMGKVKRRKAKQISRGKGPLLEHVARAVEFAKENLGPAGQEQVLVPIVILYEKKRKKRARLTPFGWP